MPERSPHDGRAPAPASVPEAVFVADGSTFLPAPVARGPWDPEAQHGGAPAGLLADALSHHAEATDMLVARLTVEFLRPVPLAPLDLRIEMLRPGRKVQLVQGSLWASGREVCRATALRLRRQPGTVSAPAELPPPPGPEHGQPPVFPASIPGDSFTVGGVQLSFVAGSYTPGPATVWIRLRRPLVAGREPSPLARAAVAADFGNGVGASLDWREHTFVNPDLTVYLDRDPVGDWVALEASMSVRADGVGLAESVLSDVRGRLGRAMQSLLIDPR